MGQDWSIREFATVTDNWHMAVANGRGDRLAVLILRRMAEESSHIHRIAI